MQVEKTSMLNSNLVRTSCTVQFMAVMSLWVIFHGGCKVGATCSHSERMFKRILHEANRQYERRRSIVRFDGDVGALSRKVKVSKTQEACSKIMSTWSTQPY